MDKFKSGAITEVPTTKLPLVPKICQQCDKEADLITITVYDETGKTHTGPFSEYGYKKNGLQLRDGYTYAHWNAVCTNHKYDSMREDWKWSRVNQEWRRLGRPKTQQECIEALRREGKLNLLLILKKPAGKRGGNLTKMGDME